MPMNNRLMRPRSGAALLAAAPDPPGPHTLLLMHFDSWATSAALLTDSSQYNRQIVNLSGAVSPGGFARFGDTLTGQNSAALVGIAGIGISEGRNVFPDLSETNHTIECWLWYQLWEDNSPSATIAHFPTYEDLTSTTGQHFYVAAGVLSFNDGMTGAASTNTFTAPISLPLEQWVHIAAVQQGSCKRIFINGQLAALATQAAPGGGCSFSTGGYVVHDGEGGYSYNNTTGGGVYIDELRISSRALYTTDFTPPAAPFSADSPAAPTANCCLPSGFLIQSYCGGPADLDIIGEFADGLCGSVITVIQQNGCA